MEEKKCSKCGVVKPIGEFTWRKDRNTPYSSCKKCKASDQNLRYKANPEKYRARRKKYYWDMPKEKRKEINKKRYWSNNEKQLEVVKQWNTNNPDKRKEINTRANIKRRSTPKGKINHSISGRILKSLKNNKHGCHWENIVGYSLQELMTHLENKFTKGMSWKKYGKWHIDHIKPISSFNFSSYEDKEFKECWALCNLQPLWKKANLQKGNKII